MPQQPSQDPGKICDPRYRSEAYAFVLETVRYAVEKMAVPRHLSAAELVAEAIAFARSQYGPFAASVLTEWGLRNARDFGNAVYLLIAQNLLAADQNDRIEDFNSIETWFPETGGTADAELEHDRRNMPKID